MNIFMVFFIIPIIVLIIIPIVITPFDYCNYYFKIELYSKDLSLWEAFKTIIFKIAFKHLAIQNISVER
jgi:hypothetical protein